MSKNAPKHPSEIPDPEDNIAAAEWIIVNEFVASELKKLAELRPQRDEDIKD